MKTTVKEVQFQIQSLHTENEDIKKRLTALEQLTHPNTCMLPPPLPPYPSAYPLATPYANPWSNLQPLPQPPVTHYIPPNRPGPSFHQQAPHTPSPIPDAPECLKAYTEDKLLTFFWRKSCCTANHCGEVQEAENRGQNWYTCCQTSQGMFLG